MDLEAALLLPHAIAWAEARASEVAESGRSLNEREIAIARAVGVGRPQLIRVALVEMLPLPERPDLRAAVLQTGVLGPNVVGLTLGYSVLICRGHLSTRLLSHEFRHVYQYECAGSIAAFFPVYVQQIVQFGYTSAPYEVDARAHEQINS